MIHMYHFEPPSDCLSVNVLCPDVFDAEVRSDEDALWSDRSHLSELVLCLEALVLRPLL